jgi:DnaJ-class molecular chaperone
MGVLLADPEIPQPSERFTEPEMVEINVDCSTCDGTGRVEGLAYAPGSPLSGPYEGGEQRCPKCEGRGYITIERCERCLKAEYDCKCGGWK